MKSEKILNPDAILMGDRDNVKDISYLGAVYLPGDAELKPTIEKV